MARFIVRYKGNGAPPAHIFDEIQTISGLHVDAKADLMLLVSVDDPTAMGRLKVVLGDSPDWLLAEEQVFPGPRLIPSAQRVLPMDRRLRRAIVITTAVVALTTSVLVVWWGYVYPRSLAATLESSRFEDESGARDAYDRLRSIPFRNAQADDLWAQFQPGSHGMGHRARPSP